jgi:CheY-like chemotaxis protein
VVFVTRHSDFNSRAKSALCGGLDLIAKPYLAFEITVKALTLALRARLNHGTPQTCFFSKATSDKMATGRAALAAEAAALIATAPGAGQDAATKEQKRPESQSATAGSAHPTGRSSASEPASDTSTYDTSSWQLSDRGFQALFSRNDSPDTFFTRAPVYLEELREHLRAAQHAVERAKLQELLRRLRVGIQSLNAEAERAELHAAFRLGSALEGMLKKLAEHNNLFTPSTFSAAAAALELLEELCDHTGTQPDFANPPIRILVVDDDPVARRAISMSVQLVFGRPDNAESGEAALALTAEKAYDLIFLDVLMPGIDGFTTCKQIHETALNRRTPVMFVTGHDDGNARAMAVDAGGCGFIPKPVLPSQITLTALTFMLRARLDASEPAPAREHATGLAIA